MSLSSRMGFSILVGLLPTHGIPYLCGYCSRERRHHMCLRHHKKASHESSPQMGCFILAGLLPTHGIPYFCGSRSANQPLLIGRVAKCYIQIWHRILCGFATLSFLFFSFPTFSLYPHTYAVGSIMYTHTHLHTHTCFF